MGKPTDAKPAAIALEDDARAAVANEEVGGAGPSRRGAGRRAAARVIDGDLARRIAEAAIGTAEVLGMNEQDVLGGVWDLEDDAVAQIDDYLRKDNAQSRRGGEYKAWEARYPAWVAWRNQLSGVRNSAHAAEELRRIIASELLARRRGELLRDAETYLRDRHLEWGEHQKMLELAQELGLSEEDVESAYIEVARRGAFDLTRSAPPPAPAAPTLASAPPPPPPVPDLPPTRSRAAPQPAPSTRVAARPKRAVSAPHSAHRAPPAPSNKTGMYVGLAAIGVVGLFALNAVVSSGRKGGEPTTSSSPGGARPPSTIGLPEESPTATSMAPSTDPRALLMAWSGAHSAKNVAAFAPLYASDVRFYGKTVSRTKAVAIKKALLTEQPDFRQSLSDITVAPRDGERVRVTFTKTVTAKGETTVYPSYLVIVGAEIVEESDEKTDAKLRGTTQRAGALDPPPLAEAPPPATAMTATELANACWCDLGMCKDRPQTPDYVQARVDCELGLAANPAAPTPLANLLFDMCLIEEHDHHLAKAAANCEGSLAVRSDASGRATVNRRLCRIRCQQTCSGADECETCTSACR